MSRWMLVLSLMAIGVGQGAVMAAFCPTTPPNGLVEILCEDFDTYCAPNEYPGGAGVTKGAQCAEGASLTPKVPAFTDFTASLEDDNLLAVWPVTSSGIPCRFDDPILGGTGPCTPRPDLPTPVAYLDNLILQFGSSYYYANTRPFGGRIPSAMFSETYGKEIGQPIPQHTFRDQVTGESNIARFTTNSFGNAKFKAVMGTDAEPLVLAFVLNSEEDGKFLFSNGFIELSYGDAANPLNRANTDYALPPDCSDTCGGNPGRSVVYPVICDVWNPNMGYRLPACPDPTVTLPPVHNAIAIGLLPMTDPGIFMVDSSKGPCYCGSSMAHGGQSSHPFMFNGQVWYEFRNTMPVPGCVRTVKDMAGNRAFLPEELKSFVFFGNPLSGGTGSNTVAIGRCQNWFTLTIMSTSAKLKHFQYFTSQVNGVTYQVTDELANIPLAYNGPFDSVRLGVGSGCHLGENGSWDCPAGTEYKSIASMVSQGHFVEFDDISLYGGKGWNAEGACCLTANGGTCLDNLLPNDCTAQGGTHKGGSTACSDPDVYCCPVPYADFDGDADVDADDFASLQICYTGALPVTGKCTCFDRTGDGKVNETDVAKFAECANGPGIELAVECP